MTYGVVNSLAIVRLRWWQYEEFYSLMREKGCR